MSLSGAYTCAMNFAPTDPADSAIARRAECHAAVLESTPGCFQGEPDWTPYYLELALDGYGNDVYAECGCGPDDDCECELVLAYTEFPIAGDPGGVGDVEIFPELDGAKCVRLYQSDQGFVRTEVVR